MTLVEVGRVCIKKLGRDAGNRAVITKVVDKTFVHVLTSQRPKDRKCNVAHLEFLNEKIDVKDHNALAHALEVAPEKLAKK